MQTLIDGVREFKHNVYPGQRELFQRLARGQSPEALFITCSDSRIDPHLLTQTLPGELFVLRNAGNIVPPRSAESLSETATIEFAVEQLRIEHIVICGHSQCEAMRVLAGGSDFVASPALHRWLQIAADAMSGLLRRSPDQGDVFTQVAQYNVLVQLENLRTHRCVAEGLSLGRLHLHGWFYRFETGNVLRYDPRQQGFVPLVP